jgi:ankyrin repeat protein
MANMPLTTHAGFHLERKLQEALQEWNYDCLDEVLQQMDREANWGVIYSTLCNSLQKLTYSMNSTECEKFLFCLKTVLQQGFNIKVPDRTSSFICLLLEQCAEKKMDECWMVKWLRCLVDRGASVNMSDMQRNRPIHLASRYALPTTLRFLIQFQSDLEVTRCKGETAIHLAARSSSPRCVQLLLKADALVNIRDINGQTPLFRTSHVQTAKHLLNYRVEVSSRDVMGNTPLHLLFMRSKIPDVNHIRLLIEYGADLNTRNIKGWTPLFFLIFGGK